MTIDATSHRISAGETVTLFGALTCPGGVDVAERTVTLYERRLTAGSAREPLGTATTEANGAYELTTSALDANTVFAARVARVPGAHVGVRVAPSVTFAGPPAGAQLPAVGGAPRTSAQDRATFSGTVSPAGAGALVVLQRESRPGSELWHPIAFGQTDEQGRYSIAHAFAAPGEASLRVLVRPRGGVGATAASQALTYEISQRQNPRLTVQSSSDSISYGQQIAFTGVASGAPNQPVTLLALRPGGVRSAIATTTTDGRGAYSFTESPQSNAFYWVATAERRSVKQFVGVSYSLSSTPAPASVQAGATLTLSGAITPSRAGQRVQLERREESGIGFRVVDVATVGADSTYSLVHTFYNAATDVLRVTVPGDSENQTVVGPAFTLRVTPTAAAALGSEAPTDPLPGEGR